MAEPLDRGLSRAIQDRQLYKSKAGVLVDTLVN